jgi:hypothetical protein
MLAGVHAGSDAQTLDVGGSARVAIHGQLQTQYAVSSVPGARAGFLVRRARLIADIAFGDFLDARIQPDFAPSQPRLQDAWVRFDFAPSFQVRMGQFKRAFDVFELSPVMDLSLIERDGRIEGLSACAGVGGVCTFSRLTEELGFAGRDQGVRVEGSSGRLGYVGTLTNGSGADLPNPNSSVSSSGRLTASLTDRARLSGQLALHDYRDTTGTAGYASAWSVDLELGTWQEGMHVQAAVAGGDNWRMAGGAGDPVRFLTGQVAASWYHALSGARLSGLEPLLRVSVADPDASVRADGAWLVTPGLMVYLGGRNKIGVNLDAYAPRGGRVRHSLKVQTYVSF